MASPNQTTPTEKKLADLYDLIDGMEIALMTTRRNDGLLVTRPMATQKQEPDADLWFVTSIDTHKIDEIEADPHVSLGYYDSNSREWVSVSGTATITQDRDRIRELYQPDWRMWFPSEGGERDGGPDDPRFALVFVDTQTVTYFKQTHSTPRVLFELAKGFVTGEQPDLGREEHLSEDELA